MSLVVAELPYVIVPETEAPGVPVDVAVGVAVFVEVGVAPQGKVVDELCGTGAVTTSKSLLLLSVS